MAKPGKDGWIRWRGNDVDNFIPEERLTTVEVRFRNKERKLITLGPGAGPTWKHYGKQHAVGNSDIMAYRVVEWADGFKPWHGNGVHDDGAVWAPGNGPVADDVEVLYVMRNAEGRHQNNKLRAGKLRWTHRGQVGDIVAWKLAAAAVPVAPQKLEAVVIPDLQPFGAWLPDDVEIVAAPNLKVAKPKEAPKKPQVGWWK